MIRHGRGPGLHALRRRAPRRPPDRADGGHRPAATPPSPSRSTTRSAGSGISAADRSATIRAVLDPWAKATDFVRPGHVFPLRARDGGVLTRPGHTEAAVDLMRLAGLTPVAVICEVLNDDGSIARGEAADRPGRSARPHVGDHRGPDRLPPLGPAGGLRLAVTAVHLRAVLRSYVDYVRLRSVLLLTGLVVLPACAPDTFWVETVTPPTTSTTSSSTTTAPRRAKATTTTTRQAGDHDHVVFGHDQHQRTGLSSSSTTAPPRAGPDETVLVAVAPAGQHRRLHGAADRAAHGPGRQAAAR